MKNNNIIIFLNGLRGVYCIENILKKKYKISAIITPTKFYSSTFLYLNEKYKFSHIKCDNVNQKSFIKKIKKFKPNVFLIIGFSQILIPEVYNIPKKGTFNFHAGRLPKYRGGSPINWQIINNESYIGVSIIKVNQIIDSGNIALSENFKLKFEDYVSDIHLKVNKIFSKLSIKLLDKIQKNNLSFKKQNERNAIYWHQRNDLDGLIKFSNINSLQAYNFIRALSHPYPGAWGKLNNNKIIRIFESELTDFNLRGQPGRICFIQNKGPYIICIDKALKITNYSIEGNKNLKLKNSDYIN